MAKKPEFSRREREMMDVVFRLGRATAAEVLGEMRTPPSYSAVRSTLSILEGKGHLTHEQDGNRYIYRPTVDPKKARQSACPMPMPPPRQNPLPRESRIEKARPQGQTPA